MMAELSNRCREAGLHIFRHRKGMLFVTPIRVRPFAHAETNVSAQVRAILDTVAANSRINRKDLAEKVLVDLASDEAEARKLSLASDLHWLVSEGYVIEFNDGSLDLPRAKVKPVETKPTVEPAVSAAPGEVVAAVASTAETKEQALTAARASTTTTEEAEIGGS
jgi:hypothetical protein